MNQDNTFDREFVINLLAANMLREAGSKTCASRLKDPTVVPFLRWCTHHHA